VFFCIQNSPSYTMSAFDTSVNTTADSKKNQSQLTAKFWKLDISSPLIRVSEVCDYSNVSDNFT